MRTRNMTQAEVHQRARDPRTLVGVGEAPPRRKVHGVVQR